jgi:hypothetical protein
MDEFVVTIETKKAFQTNTKRTRPRGGMSSKYCWKKRSGGPIWLLRNGVLH